MRGRVSAAHVALQVLGEKEADSFKVEPVLQFCDCTQKDAAAKAQVRTIQCSRSAGKSSPLTPH